MVSLRHTVGASTARSRRSHRCRQSGASLMMVHATRARRHGSSQRRPPIRRGDDEVAWLPARGSCAVIRPCVGARSEQSAMVVIRRSSLEAHGVLGFDLALRRSAAAFSPGRCARWRAGFPISTFAEETPGHFQKCGLDADRTGRTGHAVNVSFTSCPPDPDPASPWAAATFEEAIEARRRTMANCRPSR